MFNLSTSRAAAGLTFLSMTIFMVYNLNEQGLSGNFPQPLPQTNEKDEILNKKLTISKREITNTKKSDISNISFLEQKSVDKLEKRIFLLNERQDDSFWGSHPLKWSLETFKLTHPEFKWITYFHDQAFAIVLQRPNGAMFNCTLLEVM